MFAEFHIYLPFFCQQFKKKIAAKFSTSHRKKIWGSEREMEAVAETDGPIERGKLRGIGHGDEEK